MVIVGGAGQVLGGTGWGVALRVEHQTTDAFTVGAELTGGRGSIDNPGATHSPIHHWLVSLRSYTRYARPDHPWLAVIGGLGVSTMDTGLIALTPHLGGAVAALNNGAVPTLQVAGAVSWPLRRGRSFGDRAMRVNVGLGPDAKLTQPTAFDDAGPPPKTTWFLLADVGLLVPLQSANALSLNLGAAWALGQNDHEASVSVAGQQRF
jgi:hypothetical protein